MSTRYEESPPLPELRSLVHRIWWLQGDAAEGQVPFQRAMPDGRGELIFNLADPFEGRSGGVARRQPLALLVGPTRRAMEIRPTGAVDLIGVRFRPEALSGWLRVGGGELLDRTYDLTEVSAPLDRALHEQLADAGDPTRRLAVLQRHLASAVSRLRPDGRLGAAVDLAMADGRARPDAVAHAVGMSHRQLSRLLREHLGFGAKPLVRLGRFQRVLRTLDVPGRHSVAGVAMRAGYFDQAHLTRDFRLFAGIPPVRYLREARELARHFIAEE